MVVDFPPLPLIAKRRKQCRLCWKILCPVLFCSQYRFPSTDRGWGEFHRNNLRMRNRGVLFSCHRRVISQAHHREACRQVLFLRPGWCGIWLVCWLADKCPTIAPFLSRSFRERPLSPQPSLVLHLRDVEAIPGGTCSTRRTRQLFAKLDAIRQAFYQVVGSTGSISAHDVDDWPSALQLLTLLHTRKTQTKTSPRETGKPPAGCVHGNTRGGRQDREKVLQPPHCPDVDSEVWREVTFRPVEGRYLGPALTD